MTKIKINKRGVDALKITGKRYVATDSEIVGFCIRVSASGRKDYGFRYRAGGGRSGRSAGSLSAHTAGSLLIKRARLPAIFRLMWRAAAILRPTERQSAKLPL